MKTSTRRKRIVVKIRWRKERIGVTAREAAILRETRLVRFLKEIYPEGCEFQIQYAAMQIERIDRARAAERIVR